MAFNSCVSAAVVIVLVLARVLLVLAADNSTLVAELWAKDEHFYGGQCYFFPRGRGKPFEAARTFCTERQSHLVKIMDSEQNQWFVTQNHTRFARWIGLTRVDKGLGYETFRFRWVHDFSVPVYTNFDEQFWHSNERCIFMGHDGRWVDIRCDAPANVMCERNPLDASVNGTGLQTKDRNNSSADDVQSRLLPRLENSDPAGGLNNDGLRTANSSSSNATCRSLRSLLDKFCGAA